MDGRYILAAIKDAEEAECTLESLFVDSIYHLHQSVVKRQRLELHLKLECCCFVMVANYTCCREFKFGAIDGEEEVLHNVHCLLCEGVQPAGLRKVFEEFFVEFNVIGCRICQFLFFADYLRPIIEYFSLLFVGAFLHHDSPELHQAIDADLHSSL